MRSLGFWMHEPPCSILSNCHCRVVKVDVPKCKCPVVKGTLNSFVILSTYFTPLSRAMSYMVNFMGIYASGR